jgi:hypothetical protein
MPPHLELTGDLLTKNFYLHSLRLSITNILLDSRPIWSSRDFMTRRLSPNNLCSHRVNWWTLSKIYDPAHVELADQLMHSPLGKMLYIEKEYPVAI